MNSSAGQGRLLAMHFVESWLPQTATWLYGHVNALPGSVENCVVCQETQNLDQFPARRILSLVDARPRSFLGRIQRCLGLSDPRIEHLPLLEEAIQGYKPDVLHSHFGHFGWVNAALASKYSVPHIVSFYGADAGMLPQTDRRWIARYQKMSGLVNLVLCEGPHMANVLGSIGIDRAKIRVFRLGANLTRIPFEPRRPDAGPIRVLIAGSFREKKGIPYALAALGLVCRRRPGLEITIVGDSGGSEREEWEKRNILETIGAYDLSSKVRLLGFQPHRALLDEMYRHHIFLSPSVTASDGDTEGGAPVTIIEAAASGMPVVSTVHCDIPYVLSEANQPYLAPERDIEALRTALEALIERDWAPIELANRRFIEKELDLAKQAAALAGIYGEMSGKAVLAESAGR